MATRGLAGKDESHETTGAQSSDSTDEVDQIDHKSLYVIGTDVQNSFDKVLQSCQKSTYLHLYSDLRDAAQKYQLWAVNLGLYHLGHTSLDYRFREAGSAKSLTVELLISLKNALDELDSEFNSCDSSPNDRMINLESEDVSDDSDLDELTAQPWHQTYIRIILSSIDRLFHTANKIQNPRLRCTSQRAVVYKEIDPETGVDLMEEYAKRDEMFVKEFLNTLRSGKEYVPGMQDLVERLAKANTLRRKQFRVWRIYRIKMLKSLNSEDVTEKKPSAESVHPQSRSGTIHSMTMAAEALNPTMIHPQDDSSKVFDDYSFVKDEDKEAGQELPIPELSERLRSKDGFECPYCYILCSKEQGQRHRWRNHVLHDLRPYVCTDLNCQYGDYLFDKLAPWKSHEVSHLHQYHENENSLLVKSCMLCGESEVDLNHIATHLEQLSILVLPPSDIYADSSLPNTSVSIMSTYSRHMSSVFSKSTPSSSRTPMSEMEWSPQHDLMSTIRTASILDRLNTKRQESAGAQAMFLPALDDQGIDEKLQLQLIESRKSDLGLHHPHTLNLMQTLASTYWVQTRYEDAERLQLQVMEIRQSSLGADHPDTLTSMASLASTYTCQRRYQDAEELQLRVLKTRKSTLGSEHTETLTSMAWLGRTYWHQCRYEDAEELQLRVLKARKFTLGSEHTETLTSMAWLGATYWHQRRYQDAEKLQLQVMKAREKTLGSDHPDTLAITKQLALTYREQDRWYEAEKLQFQILEARMLKLGPAHPDTLTSTTELAFTYKQRRKRELAEELPSDSPETEQSRLGSGLVATLAYLDDLKSIYEIEGEVEKADEVQSQAMGIRRSKLPTSHPLVLNLLNDLGFIYEEQYQWEELDKLQRHVSKANKI